MSGYVIFAVVAAAVLVAGVEMWRGVAWIVSFRARQVRQRRGPMTLADEWLIRGCLAAGTLTTLGLVYVVERVGYAVLVAEQIAQSSQQG